MNPSKCPKERPSILLPGIITIAQIPPWSITFSNPTLISKIWIGFQPIKRLQFRKFWKGLCSFNHSDGSWKIRLGTFESGQAEKAFKEEPLLKERRSKSCPARFRPQPPGTGCMRGNSTRWKRPLKRRQDLRKKGLLPALKKFKNPGSGPPSRAKYRRFPPVPA